MSVHAGAVMVMGCLGQQAENVMFAFLRMIIALQSRDVIEFSRQSPALLRHFARELSNFDFGGSTSQICIGIVTSGEG
jgi:hypothetical protein